jgi:hypothetical protein
MPESNHLASAVLIGDLVGSRTSVDRRALHASLAGALTEVNDTLAPVAPLRITVGDEYQGAFAAVGDALAASLLVRLALLPDSDVRHGVGWGGSQVLVESPRVEDGPAWWAARDAIVAVEEGESRTAGRGVRTAYRRVEGVPGPEPAAVNAALMLRDRAVSGLSPRSLSVLRGLLAGRTQGEIAGQEGISASAVSQRVRHDGLGVLLAAHELLGGVG